MLLMIVILFTGVFVAPIVTRISSRWSGILLSLFPMVVFAYFISISGTVLNGNNINSSYAWVSFLDIHVSFRLDGLALLFSLLVTGIGFLVMIYSNAYMKNEEHKGRFYSFMLLFMTAMLGLVTTDSLISLYVFWELTSVSSFLLIGFHHHQDKSRDAALQALLITTFGGLAMLAGFVILGSSTGSYEISELLNYKSITSNQSLYIPVLLLILLGAFTKSAQFPFHFWLPQAMKAPTPVSAYLHSASMVNAGIYLLARMNPLLGNTTEWHVALVITGLATMFIGAYFSITQKDLKRILAYATISALGILIMLIGIDTVLSIKAALLYLIVHGLYKANLFMVVGVIDKKTGTRNIYELGNLSKTMPITSIIAILGLFSMASLPPMIGYISKELIYEAKLRVATLSPYLLVFGIISFVFLFAVSLLVTYRVFFAKPAPSLKIKGPPGIPFLLGPAIFGVLSLLIAIFPTNLERIIEAAVASVEAEKIDIDLKMWHGFTNVFWLSLLTVSAGVLLFFFREKLFKIFSRLNKYFSYFELSYIFSRFIDGLLKFAGKNTSFIQHGYHRYYLMIVFIVSSIFSWYYLSRANDVTLISSSSELTIPGLGIALLAIIAAIITPLTRSKIVAIITMGAIGYAISIIFMLYGAIDLAITFILVDTLTIILFVMVVNRLPEFARFSGRITRIRDLVIALSAGGFMAVLALIAANFETSNKLKNFYLENSLDQAYGKNVVNVILVDFRALDTLGEITVLLLAGVSIYSLFKLKKK